MPEKPTGTLTFLFTDIEGSTKRWEQYPVVMRGAFGRQESILRGAIEANGGYTYKMIGDAFQCAFPTALQALHAAIDAQRALYSEPWPTELGEVRVRMALHTGVTEIREGDYFGPLLNRAARLLATAHGGQVLLTQSTYELLQDVLPPGISLRDLGEHRLKDLTRAERIFQIVTQDLPSDFPPPKTLGNRPNNLPGQPTALIGREKEIVEVCSLLRRPEVALVTLTGPGGTGKTRLALQVAGDLIDAFSFGVWFVDLAPLIDPSLFIPAMATVLGVKERPGTGHSPTSLIDTLIEFLSEKQLLLLLDNFEQIDVAATQVSQLLRACPKIKVLVTSRVPLRVSGEHEYPVPPLALPDPDHLPSLEQLTQYEAVRLFIERTVAIKPDFEVTNENAPAVAEICARLDGLPLAIELAAARIRLLPPQALLNRLSSRLKLLTEGRRDLPARQRTLRGTIEWSYDLLEEGEKQLFRRMSVFHGVRTLEALEAVCNSEGLQVYGQLDVDLLEGIEGLVSKSLMQQREGEHGEAQFWVLETIEEYAREKLAESGEEEDLRRQHLAYYLTIAEEAELQLTGTRQLESLGRLEEEYDNIRAALQWAREEGEKRDAERGLKLAAAIWRFWGTLGKYREGRVQLEGALSSVPDMLDGPNQPTDAALSKELARAKGRAYYAVGMLAHNQGELAASRRNIEKGLEMARYAEDQICIADCLNALAMLASMAGDYSSEQSLREESLAVLRETEDKTSIAVSLRNLGHTAQLQEDYGSAHSLYEQSLALARGIDNRSLVAALLGDLGSTAYEQNDYSSARSLYRESLAILRETGNKTGVAYLLYYMALMSDIEGDYKTAASLYRQSIVMHREAEDKLGISLCLGGLGDWTGVRAGQGRAQGEVAVRLLGAASEVLETIGFVLRPRDRHRYEHGLSIARARLGDEVFEKAWAEGKAMNLEQAIEYALGTPPAHSNLFD